MKTSVTFRKQVIVYTIWYQFCHGYTLCSGFKEIPMWADDEYDPREVMWEGMKSDGHFTLPVTAKIARILGQKEVE